MSKPKTAAVEFDKAVFTEQAAAVAWLDQHGMDSSSCVPLPASFVFKQRSGTPNAGKKSLGTGVTALLTKAFGKDKDDEDDDEKKKKKDEKRNDMEDEKVEKADDSPDEDDDDDESEAADDETDVDADADDDSDDIEEDEESDEVKEQGDDEADAEDATEHDPVALKKEADNIVDMIAHFEIACEHAERMKGESVKSPDLFTKLHADATALVADLRAAYKDGFADQAMESAIDDRKAGAVEKEEMPVDSATPENEYGDVAKALKAARKNMELAAKSLPRLAVVA